MSLKKIKIIIVTSYSELFNAFLIPFFTGQGDSKSSPRMFFELQNVASYRAYYNSIIKKWGSPSSFGEPKAIIKGVFNRLYCCYGNLSYRGKDDQ